MVRPMITEYDQNLRLNHVTEEMKELIKMYSRLKELNNLWMIEFSRTLTEYEQIKHLYF